MNSIQFNIVRSSDRELFDALCAMAIAETPGFALQDFSFGFLSDESINVPRAELAQHKALHDLVSDEVRLFRTVTIATDKASVVIERHDQGQNSPERRDNTRPFDVVSVNPVREPKLTGEQFASIVAFSQRFLGKFSISALQSYLGDDAKQHFGARETALTRLETLTAKLLYDMEDARKRRERDLAEKELHLEEHYQARLGELEQQTKALEAKYSERHRQLDNREHDLDLQDAKAARRKERVELKARFKEWSKEFEITSATRNLRWIIHGLCLVLLLVFGTAAGVYLKQSLEQVSTAQLVAIHIKQAVLSALFVAISIFYVKWNTQWFQKRSNEEFRLKRMELDFDRASWLVELIFQWKDEHKDEPLPSELLDRLSGQLFVNDREEAPPAHPYESLGTVLFGASSKVKLSPAGAELEIDRKGLQQLKKDAH